MFNNRALLSSLAASSRQMVGRGWSRNRTIYAISGTNVTTTRRTPTDPTFQISPTVHIMPPCLRRRLHTSLPCSPNTYRRLALVPVDFPKESENREPSRVGYPRYFRVFPSWRCNSGRSVGFDCGSILSPLLSFTETLRRDSTFLWTRGENGPFTR